MAREKMKTFKGYLTEFVIQSTSDYVFDTLSNSISDIKIPISGPMFKRIWPDTIRATVFHTTSLEGLKGLKKLEGGKKSISAFFSMMSRYMETGVASGGDIHVVAEMDADVLVSARDDIWSQVDKTGRRWVEMSWFANAQWGGTGPKFNKVEKDLNTLIKDLVKKYAPKEQGQPLEIWSDMKSHLKAGREGGGKRLSLVIKDYFDGIEKVLKANKEVMGNIIYGYTKSKRMTDNAWDEQIVNNIKIKKIHTWETSQGSFPPSWVQKQIKNIAKWPVKIWGATIELEAYTREVVKKEIGR
jgi:hypothetical protein